jgi:hypothetical protein
VSAAAGAEPLRDGDSGWYLYGVVGAEAAPPAPRSTSVDSRHEVVVLEEGPLAAVASRVPLDEFEEPTLAEHLGDAAWLEEKIRSHEQVLDAVLEHASVVPCRFCTIYRSESDLRRFLVERRRELVEALASVEGRVELGVKAFVDRERFAAADESLREAKERVAGAEGGRAYLEARRLERTIGEELARFQQALAGELHERLLVAAEDGVLLDMQPPELSGRDDEMLFNAAYLVADRPRFEQGLGSLAEEQRAHGVELELTGPWPPYNFVPAELRAP